MRKSTDRERLRRRRNKLWELNGGKCYWCGCNTVLPPKKRPPRQVIPDNEATIDHLRNRLDINREEPNSSNEERTVLSCRKCNFVRGKEKERELGIEALRALNFHGNRTKREIILNALERKKADSRGSIERSEEISFSSFVY